MNRNALYAVIALLVAGLLVLGYFLYQERQQPEGIKIEMGEKGISIQTN
ncbi:hypothetical protein [Oricola sp.]|nr:hypothetical protein [Oricola sp.]MCI5075841.1 hypothetical protein [Oricola sp.]